MSLEWGTLRFVLDWLPKSGGVGFVVSHPNDRDKDVVRMGHPWFVLNWVREDLAGWGSWYPTLTTETKTSLG
jgi:hypothetical protein